MAYRTKAGKGIKTEGGWAVFKDTLGVRASPKNEILPLWVSE